MFCIHCGTQVADDDKYCWRCGAKLITVPNKANVNNQTVSKSRTNDRSYAVKKEDARTQADMSTQNGHSGTGFRGAQIARNRSYANPDVTAQEQMPADIPADIVKTGPVPPAQAQHQPVVRPQKTKLPGNQDQSAARQVPVSSGGISSFYVFDFFRSMFTNKENVPLIIYLVLNIILIGLVTTGLFGLPIGYGFLLGFALYLISVSIALSSIGESILRYQTGCHKISDPEVLARIEPIFNEVYGKARQMNPNISDKVNLFMNDEKCPNAFATGRKTVCITRGLLDLTDDEIRATLGHEFGHLSHKDTDRILVVAIGNMFIEGLYILFQLGAIIADIFMQIFSVFTGDASIFVSLMSTISRFFTLVILAAFMRLWTALGTALCMKTSRGNEYQADEFAVNLGYGENLIDLLRIVGGGPRPKGLFASLASSHPHSDDRIARIRQLLGEEAYQ